MPEKESQQTHTQKDIQLLSTTGENNYGISKQGSAGIRGNVLPLNKLKRPEAQSVDEWLRHYGFNEKGE